MSTHRYKTLIEKLCDLSGYNDPVLVMQGKPVEIEDTLFSLIYNKESNTDLLFIFCDFGHPPCGCESDVYRMLLQKNLLSYHGGGPVFTVLPDTGRIVLAQHVRFDAITPEALMLRLAALSVHAHEWRKELFRSPKSLDPTTRTPHATPSTLASLSRR